MKISAILTSLVSLILLTPPIFSQEVATVKSETVASITTFTGTISLICIKTVPEDARPTSNFMLTDESGNDTLVLLPGNFAEQDKLVAQILGSCAQNQVEDVILSGALMKHTNSFGERVSLVVNRIEVNLFGEPARIRQQIVFTLEK